MPIDIENPGEDDSALRVALRSLVDGNNAVDPETSGEHVSLKGGDGRVGGGGGDFTASGGSSEDASAGAGIMAGGVASGAGANGGIGRVAGGAANGSGGTGGAALVQGGDAPAGTGGEVSISSGDGVNGGFVTIAPGQADGGDLGRVILEVSGGLLMIIGIGDFADDAAAAAGGVPVEGIYRNGSVLMVRVA